MEINAGKPVRLIHLTFPPTAVQTEAEGDVKKLEAEIREVREEMGELKTVLYAKFGNSINLEE